MRGFFGDLLCECESVSLHEYAMTTPDGDFEVTELLVICIDCRAVFYEAADVPFPDIVFNDGQVLTICGVVTCTIKRFVS